MQNLQLKKAKNKRSIESLIDQSALDNSYNAQAQQLRKAFNETLIAMNMKNTQKQKQIDKLKIIIRQYQQNKMKYDNRMKRMQEQCVLKQNQYQEMFQKYKQLKKKNQYLQYKLENMIGNRILFQDAEDNQQENNLNINKKKIKNEVYNQFNKIITKKIQYFTKDIKQCSMSHEAQQKIQAFLQELIYLNPYSQFNVIEQIKLDKKYENKGKIKKQHVESITEQSQWKMLQKSLQNLKEINKKRNNIIQKSQKQQVKQRSVSINKRKRLFNN